MTLPEGPFDLILSDPPWRFVTRSDKGRGRSQEQHYTTMTMPQLLELPVERIAAKDAALILWVYDPMYPQALELGAAWGFQFSTRLFTWLKMRFSTPDMFGQDQIAIGLGYHTRSGSEQAWLFKRGKGLPVLDHSVRREFFAPRREHSRKPDEVYGFLETLYGDRPRVELFARQSWPGWTAWGNETGKFS